jgi:ribosome-associated translation inhibitor RaiA
VRFLPKLEKEFDLVVRVVLSKGTHHKKGEVFECRLSLALPGDYLEVTETGETPEIAIDKVEAGLNRKIRRYKSKWRDRTRRALRKVKEMLKLP